MTSAQRRLNTYVEWMVEQLDRPESERDASPLEMAAGLDGHLAAANREALEHLSGVVNEGPVR